jgi:hypothetical protein
MSKNKCGRPIISKGVPRVRLNPQEFDLIKQFRAIKEKSNEMGLNENDVKHGWIKTKDASLFFSNPSFDSGKELDLDFEKILESAPKLNIEKVGKKVYDGEFDKLVFTDVHIGMDTSDKGRSLYPSEWNEDILFERLEKMISYTLAKQNSNVLYLLDLGDYLDGFNGQTTRGGHALPQNMSNQKAFDVGFTFKTMLITYLAPFYDTIHVRNICNDNHSGDFSYFVNQFFKKYIERDLKNVKVTNQTQFIDYEVIGNKCFVTTHGKDTHNMKFGFKPKIDPGQINRILGYLNTNQLLNKGYEIIFEKGDSHLYLFDSSSSDVFKYYNYPAFSPSSNWVAMNFQLGRSGFVHFNYGADQKSINEYFFK